MFHGIVLLIHIVAVGVLFSWTFIQTTTINKYRIIAGANLVAAVCPIIYIMLGAGLVAVHAFAAIVCGMTFFGWVARIIELQEVLNSKEDEC